jgi:hypothetical protein
MYLGTGWPLILFSFPLASKLCRDNYYKQFVPQVSGRRWRASSAWGDRMTVTAHDEVIPFTAGDGRTGNVLHDPVLLVHGAGVRANIFRATVPVTIVDALLDAMDDAVGVCRETRGPAPQAPGRGHRSRDVTR